VDKVAVIGHLDVNCMTKRRLHYKGSAITGPAPTSKLCEALFTLIAVELGFD
jgi:hypothetical protein